MIKTFFRKIKKQSMVEYALIIGLVAIGVIATIDLIGGSQNDTFDTTNAVLGEALEFGEMKSMELRHLKNQQTINHHNREVVQGNRSDVPNSGNDGSQSWQNPNSPSSNSPPIAKFIVIPSNEITTDTEVSF